MNLHTLKLAGLVIGGLLTTGATAQVKTDGEWRGLGGAALSVSSGNTTSSALLVNLDMARATERDKITLGASVNYARNKSDGVSQTTANKWAATGQYDYNLTPVVYGFGKLGLEADRVVNLRLRSTLVGGLGYHVIKTKEANFDVFGGVGYITDKYRVEQRIGDETDTSFSRVTLLLGEESSHQLSSAVSFKQRLEIYPGLSGDKAVLAKFNAGLGVAMSSTLNLTVGVVDTYNSKPPAGLKKNDFGFFTGVSIKLGAL